MPDVKGRRTLLALSLLVSALLGALAASGVFTFVSAHGTAYLSNDPAACVNCHIMREQYDGWLHGSHHAVATCNDCHLPHDNVVHKFYVKALNGYHHSKAFTLQDFEEPIRIKAGNAYVLEANCLRCWGFPPIPPARPTSTAASAATPGWATAPRTEPPRRSTT
jgi:cytochrome c nitrite reductase small subunit